MERALRDALLEDIYNLALDPDEEQLLWEYIGFGSQHAGTLILVFAYTKREGVISGSTFTLTDGGRVLHRNWSSRDSEVEMPRTLDEQVIELESDSLVGEYLLPEAHECDFQGNVLYFGDFIRELIRFAQE